MTLVVQREEPPYQYVVVEGTVVDTTKPTPLDVREAIAIRYLGEEGGRAFVQSLEGQKACCSPSAPTAGSPPTSPASCTAKFRRSGPPCRSRVTTSSAIGCFSLHRHDARGGGSKTLRKQLYGPRPHHQPVATGQGIHQPGSGKGCAMNVISYINGDEQITDFPATSARPLASFVQLCNDLLAGPDGYLSPENSLLVLDLGWLTVGTADVADAIMHIWVTKLLISPPWGVVRYAGRRGGRGDHRRRGATSHVRAWRRAINCQLGRRRSCRAHSQ